MREWIAHALGRDVLSLAPLGGGDVADAFAVELADGTPVFAKTHLRAPPGFFTTEAAGLAWLREAQAVSVPEVLAVSDEPPLLILEWIEPGRPKRATEAELGRALAALHAAGAPSFGREDRRTTGSRRLPNEPCETWAEFYARNRLLPLARTWAEFYARNRLLPLARLAADAKALPRDSIRDLERVAGRLGALGGGPEPPARATASSAPAA
jgi:fructosamine-3-kinase